MLNQLLAILPICDNECLDVLEQCNRSYNQIEQWISIILHLAFVCSYHCKLQIVRLKRILKRERFGVFSQGVLVKSIAK